MAVGSAKRPGVMRPSAAARPWQTITAVRLTASVLDIIQGCPSRLSRRRPRGWAFLVEGGDAFAAVVGEDGCPPARVLDVEPGGEAHVGTPTQGPLGVADADGRVRRDARGELAG